MHYPHICTYTVYTVVFYIAQGVFQCAVNVMTLLSVLLINMLFITPTSTTHHNVFGLSYSGRIVLPHTSTHSSLTPLLDLPTPSPLLHLHAVNHLPSHPKSTHHTVTTPCVYILVKTTTAKTTNCLTALLACLH